MFHTLIRPQNDRCPSGTEGKKDCRFGENCRFDRDMHGIEMTVVKTVKVGAK